MGFKLQAELWGWRVSYMRDLHEALHTDAGVSCYSGSLHLCSGGGWVTRLQATFILHAEVTQISIIIIFLLFDEIHVRSVPLAYVILDQICRYSCYSCYSCSHAAHIMQFRTSAAFAPEPDTYYLQTWMWMST